MERVKMAVPGRDFAGDTGILRALRMVKSPAEIDKIESACTIAGRAFDRVSEIARAGVPLSNVFRRFQMLCLEEGADWVPYLAGAAAAEGYGDVISPATEKPIEQGDVLRVQTQLHRLFVETGLFNDRLNDRLDRFRLKIESAQGLLHAAESQRRQGFAGFLHD